MLRGIAGLALLTLVASGCAGLRLPNANDPAPVLTQLPDARGTTFLLAPWAYDQGNAFLCLTDPGDTFQDHGAVPADAGCVELGVDLQADRLAARFAPLAIPPQLRAAWLASSPPWFLAVSGVRGAQSERLVMSIEASPIPSDAGPS